MQEYKLGKNLRVILKDRKISQKKFAEMVGVHESAIVNYIKDYHMPNVMTLIMMADTLKISLDDLVFGNDHIRQLEERFGNK